MKTKSLCILAFIVIFLTIGTGIRITGLKDIDLYFDEAFIAETSESFVRHGELNNFRYSGFYQEHLFRYNMIACIPPLYPIIQSVFMPLKEVWNPNIIPRLPSLFSSIFLMILLYFVSKEIFSSKMAGLIVIILMAFNGYQIGMSRLALPYSILPLFLCLVFWLLIHALERNDKRYWIATSIFLVLSFYTHQHALFFGFIYLASLIICFKKRKIKHALNLTVCFFAAFLVSLVWILFLSKTLIFHQIFLKVTNELPSSPTEYYNFSLQLSKIIEIYYFMLPSFILRAAFFIGLVSIICEAVRQKGYAKILLVIWALLPFTIMLSQTMHIDFIHLYFACPPVMIITAYGIYAFIRYILNKVYLRYFHIGRYTYVAIIILFSISISSLQLKHLNLFYCLPGLATYEFRHPNIASRACDYIKRHYDNEVIIAPIGLSESYYLDKFVYDNDEPNVVNRNFGLILESSAWVFIGDVFYNLFYRGESELSEFDRYVQENGKLIMHSNSISDLTGTNNKSGYVLYYIEKQNSIPGYD